MRAEKRKKNAPKELNRLKQALTLDKKGEVAMTDMQEIATVVPAEKIKKQADVNMEEAEPDGKTVSTTVSSLYSLFVFFKLRGDVTPFSVSRVSYHVCLSVFQMARWTWTASATRKLFWMNMDSIRRG